MNQVWSVMLFCCFALFSLTGCGGGGDTTIVPPEAAVPTVELTPEQQEQYNKEMSAQMNGGN